MNKRELAFLGRVYAAEVSGALSGASPLVRSKSRVAEILAEDGYLQIRTETVGGRYPVEVTGYELTHFGRLSYCVQAPTPTDKHAGEKAA